jgi:tRNA threonylcarbamoyl adenosine modification protein (Sua5/YciO/YrdC/YwlC family)
MHIFNSLQDEDFITSLTQGAVGVMPTDTVYGLVTIAKNEESVAKLYALKSREHKPGTIIAANVEQLINLGMAESVVRPMQAYWPGPVSIIIPTGDNLSYLRQDVPGLACRVPIDPVIHELLLRTGPLLTTSANHPGLAPATNLIESQAYFGDQVDFYVDGGEITDHQPSTVIRIEDDRSVTVLRQGAVVINEKETRI